MIQRLLITAVLFTGTAVWAQAPQALGKVTEVQGVVTVSNGVTVATAVPGTVVIQGNQFVTASSGAARLVMDNGCDIRLKPNESLVIDGRRSCEALIAQIQPVGSNVAAAAVGGGANLAIGVGIAGSIMAAGLESTKGGNVPLVPISGQ